MNLYEFRSTHYGPKDQHTAIDCYIVAEDDEGVFNRCSMWGVAELVETGVNGFFGTQAKQQVLEWKGDHHREDLQDYYYGHTTYGWELKYENISQKQIDNLIKLNINIKL